jgi:excisionase family DNA binding protein
MHRSDARALIHIAAWFPAPRWARNEMISEQRKGGPARSRLRFCMCVTGMEVTMGDLGDDPRRSKHFRDGRRCAEELGVTLVYDGKRAVIIAGGAKLLGIGRNQAYEAARKGEIPAIRIGARLLVLRSALDRLLKEGGEPTAS